MVMKNTEAAKVTIHNADLNWTPRPATMLHGHADRHQPGCYQCEALAKWTKHYMAKVNGR